MAAAKITSPVWRMTCSHDLAGEAFGIGRRMPVALAVAAQEDLGPEPGGLDRPAFLVTQDMGRIAGRESRHQDEAAIDQPPQRAERRRRR